MGKIIVAIDGPSGAGKSTAARMLARELGYLYIDTGALYRAIGWKAAKQGVRPIEGPELQALCEHTEVELKKKSDGLSVYVDGADVTGLIRTPDMSMMASAVSAQPCVRRRLLELQRALGRQGGVVLEGRDIGTVVFPEAQAKFYLDADVKERARRRFVELKEKGEPVEFEKTVEEVVERDYNDSHRDIAPLCKADDAIVVDSSSLTAVEVVAFMKAKVEEIAAGTGK